MSATGSTLTPTSPDLWLQVVEDEYLREFIPSGNSSVKFVSGGPGTLDNVQASLQELAVKHRLLYSFLDPNSPREGGKKPDLHSIDRFFFTLTQNVDWPAYARRQAHEMVRSLGMSLPSEAAALNLDDLAEHNGRPREWLLGQFGTVLTSQQLRDRSMGAEFRNALAAMVHAQLVPDSLLPSTEEVLVSWLRGVAVKGGASALKRVQIYERITPANGWTMLRSFTHWIEKTGYAGVLAVLDFRPYQRVRVPQTAIDQQLSRTIDAAIERGGSLDEIKAMKESLAQPAIMYGSVAYVRMLSLLRGFIDSAGEIERTFLVVLTDPEYYGDRDGPRCRRVTDYDALSTRIGQEVYDPRFSNPCAALVHLGDTA